MSPPAGLGSKLLGIDQAPPPPGPPMSGMTLWLNGRTGLPSATSTAIAPASNGIGLPASVIHVDSTTGFPSSGTIHVTTTSGRQLVTYTGTSGGNQFTGCTGGTGTMNTGNPVVSHVAISSWPDQSGSGHDFTQATMANQPFVGSGINGRKTVDFDGNGGASTTFLANASNISNFVTTTAWTAFTVINSDTTFDPGGGVGSGDFTCAMIISGAATAIWGVPVRGNNPGSPTTIEAYQYDGSSKAVGQTITTPTPCQTASFLSSGTLSISINKATPSTLSGVGAALVIADSMQIGTRRGQPSGSNYDGSIGEIILYNRALSGTEITTVQTYLSYQWAL